jgi:hypothetical protein
LKVTPGTQHKPTRRPAGFYWVTRWHPGRVNGILPRHRSDPTATIVRDRD